MSTPLNLRSSPLTTSTPLSLSPSPLTSLGDYSYKSLIEDDFSTGKLSLKAKVASLSGGVANFKSSHGVEKSINAQEIKIQFPWKNYYVWLGTRSASDIKVHIDLGEFDIIKKSNLFVNLRLGKGKDQVKFGSVYKGENLLTHTRFTTDVNANWELLQRRVYKQNDIVYAGVDQYDFKTARLIRYDHLLGYFTKDADFFVRHLSTNPSNVAICPGFGIGKIAANFIYRKNSNVFGAELSFDGPAKLGLAVAGSAKIQKTNVKAKFDVLSQNISLVAKGKFNDTFAFVVSTQVSLKENKASGPFPVPIGATLEINL